MFDPFIINKLEFRRIPQGQAPSDQLADIAATTFETVLRRLYRLRGIGKGAKPYPGMLQVLADINIDNCLK